MAKHCLIVGGGLTGLTLARLLAKERIPSTVFEAAATLHRQNHGLTLCTWSYEPLLLQLGITEDVLSRTCAVDAGLATSPSRGFTDMDIRLNKRVVDLERLDGGVRLIFDDGDSVEGACAVVCDGVHSKLRHKFLPQCQPKILPTVCYAGTRRIPVDNFRTSVQPHLQRDGQMICSTSHETADSTRLEIAINDFNASRGFVEVQWVFSRPPREDNDPLHRPDRKIDEAKQIPAAFYEEVTSLHSSLPEVFQFIFTVENMQKDHSNHWLMRSLHVDAARVKELYTKYNSIFYGDAVHAMPIYRGLGGNHAILDALELARALDQQNTASPEQTSRVIPRLIDEQSKRWLEGIDASQRMFS